MSTHMQQLRPEGRLVGGLLERVRAAQGEDVAPELDTAVRPLPRLVELRESRVQTARWRAYLAAGRAFLAGGAR